VEHLLSVCDFGEDFVPTEGRDLFAQTDAPATAPSASNIKPDHEEVSVFSEEGDTTKEEGSGPVALVETVAEESLETGPHKGVPPMRQDMLGVNHDVIMDQIRIMINKQTKKKSVEENKCGISSDDPSWAEADLSLNPKEIREEAISYKKRQRQFMKYLQKQAATKKADLDRMSGSAKDKEFLEEEKLDRLKRSADAIISSMEEEDQENDQSEDEYDEDSIEEERLYYSNNRNNFNEHSERL